MRRDESKRFLPRQEGRLRGSELESDGSGLALVEKSPLRLLVPILHRNCKRGCLRANGFSRRVFQGARFDIMPITAAIIGTTTIGTIITTMSAARPNSLDIERQRVSKYGRRAHP